jgi:ATP-dependent Clp protease ATP-binding subunit ClpB
MDINRFTEKAREALASAQSLAVRNSHQQIDAEHLLGALLEQDRGLASSVINKAGVDKAGPSVDSIKRQLEEEIQRMPRVEGPSGGLDQVYVTPRLNSLLVQAEAEGRVHLDRASAARSAR